MDKILNVIKNKNFHVILDFTKLMSDNERYSTISKLKEIDINRDILQGDGLFLEGNERDDFYENRKQVNICLNYFLLCCVRSYEDLKRLETKHEYYTSKPYYSFLATNNYDAIVDFYTIFPPNYLDKLVKDITKERFYRINFKILWKLYENKWVSFDEVFFVNSLFNLEGFDNDHFEDSAFLIAHPELINQVFLKFYRYEIPILDLIKSKTIDYSNGLSSKASVYWTEVIKILVEHNSIPNRDIIPHLLESLLNNWKKPHLDWHVRLIELFEPTKVELIENQLTLFAILGSGQSSLINFAIQKIKTIYEEKGFEKSIFINNVPTIFSNDKIINTILIVLEIIDNLLCKSVKIDLEYREQLCLLLMQTDSKIQENTAKILVQYFHNNDLRNIILPYANFLKSKARSILNIENTVSENIRTLITQEIRHISIEPIPDWNGILLQVGNCIRTKSARDIEIFFEAIIQLQSEIPKDFAKQLKPYTKQLFNKYWEIETMRVFSFFIECWIENKLKDFSENEYKIIPFLAKKAKRVLDKLENKNCLPFLSTPTHGPFFVHPIVLLNKLFVYEKNHVEVDLEDLIIACNRILLSELQGNFKDELKLLKGYYSEALNYLFEENKQINFTSFTLPLWTQITRIKNPFKKFEVFEKSKAGNYPTVVSPFNINFKIVKDTIWYRIELENNWSYSWFNKEKTFRCETIFYNTASSNKAKREDIYYQLSINPNYVDAILCRYIPNTASYNEVDGFEECFYPMKFVLENQLRVYHGGWLYVAVCLLFEKKISRDLATEYIHLAISRNENLDFLAEIIARLICDKFAPVNRLIEYLDKSTDNIEIKKFQFKILSNCLKNFMKENLPLNSKKLISYHNELQIVLKDK